jgi:hypothetical protein
MALMVAQKTETGSDDNKEQPGELTALNNDPCRNCWRLQQIGGYACEHCPNN